MLTRLKVLTVQVETEKGTALDSSAISILTEDLSINPSTEFTSRKGHGLYTGYNEKGVLGLFTGTCSFRTELRGNGTTGFHAGIAALLQGCGLKQSSLVYTLPTTSVADQKTVTLTVYEDGLKKQLFGSMGTCTIEGSTGERVFLNFEFQGCYSDVAWVVDGTMAGADTVAALPMIFRGGIFKIASTAKRIGRMTLDLGAQVVQTADLNAKSGVAFYQITEFDPAISIDPEVQLVAVDVHYDDWLKKTENAAEIQFTDGLTTVTIAISKMQYKDITTGDRNGIFVHEINAQCNNSGATAITITTAAVSSGE